MPARAFARTLLVAALAGFSGCDSLTGSDLRDGRMGGTWAMRPFEGAAHATVFDGTLYLAGDIPRPGLATYVSITAGEFVGPGTYPLDEVHDASVMHMLSYDEIGAHYAIDPDRPGTLVTDEVENGTISGGISFSARSSGEQPVGSRARLQARFKSVPLEYRP